MDSTSKGYSPLQDISENWTVNLSRERERSYTSDSSTGRTRSCTPWMKKSAIKGRIESSSRYTIKINIKYVVKSHHLYLTVDTRESNSTPGFCTELKYVIQLLRYRGFTVRKLRHSNNESFSPPLYFVKTEVMSEYLNTGIPLINLDDLNWIFPLHPARVTDCGH